MTTDSIPVRSNIEPRLRALGINPAQLLRHAGLPPSLFQQADARVSTRQFFALWSALGASGAAPDMGLRFATDVPADQYHLAFMVALHSAGVRAALGTLGRYKRLVGPEEVVIAQDGAEVSLQFRWVMAKTDAPPFLVDAAFASVMQLFSRGIGRKVTPARLDLTRAPAHERLLKRHFGCPVHFNQSDDQLVLAASMLDEPFTTHNAELVEVLIPGLEAQLRTRASGLTLVEQTQVAVARRLRGERPDLESIAAELSLSSRTLQRRLKESGTSYQALLDDVRQKAARRLLMTDLEAAEIAFLLGFEELNSFSRAFLQWEGTTPTRWRAQQDAATQGPREHLGQS